MRKPEDLIHVRVLLDRLTKSGDLKWFALSVKTADGTTIAYHHKDAPKRPKGIT